MKEIFETFRKVGSFEIGNLTANEPSCFNGIVNVTKQQITIEDVTEPIEVIQARIQKLYDECDNHHHRGPLRAIAEKYGLKL